MSVKMLDFKPSDTSPGPEVNNDFKSFMSLMDEDIWFGCTPDLPVLRYTDGIPVFIWDDFKTTKDLPRTLGIAEGEVKVQEQLMFTKDRFLPFINKNKSFKFMYHLPASPTWDQTIADLKFPHVAKPLIGKVLSFSTRAIQALDNYMYNSSLHQRVLTTLVDRTGNKEKEMKAWVYFLPSNSFTKYDPHVNKYNLLKDFVPKACTTNHTYNSPEGTFSSSYTDVRE